MKKARNLLLSNEIIQTVIAVGVACYPVVASSLEDGWQWSDAAAIAAGLYAIAMTAKARANEDPVFTPRGVPGPSRALVEEKLKAQEFSTPAGVEIEDTIDSREEGPDKLPTNYFIQFLSDSKLKTAPVDSAHLTDRDVVDIPAGQRMDVISWAFAEDVRNHIEVEVYTQEKVSSWFVYTPHVRLENNEGKVVDLSAADPLVVNVDKTPLNVKGFSTLYLEDPILPKGHFYWREATKNGARVPQSRVIVDNIIAIARELEDIRKMFGNKPIVVNSWYRDPQSNAAVGGASKSKHLEGHAVDINIVGVNPREVQRRLDDWKGGMGCYPSFTHLDLGSRRRWHR